MPEGVFSRWHEVPQAWGKLEKWGWSGAAMNAPAEKLKFYSVGNRELQKVLRREVT